METVRIEIHLSKAETKILDAIAKQDGRSRKNICETEIRKLIKERGKGLNVNSEKNFSCLMQTELQNRCTEQCLECSILDLSN